MKKITLDSKEYPISRTMGAFLRFKELTGKDVSQVGNEMADVIALLYTFVECGCRIQKVEFPYNVQEFADRIDVSQMAELKKELTDSSITEKKRGTR